MQTDDPFAHSNQAKARTWLFNIGQPSAVVGDAQEQGLTTGIPPEIDTNLIGSGMACDIGQSFLDQAKYSDTDGIIESGGNIPRKKSTGDG